jgi:hypothetical protein
VKRNYSSVRGAGFGRAFRKAAEDLASAQPVRLNFSKPEPGPEPVCGRSADVGSVHIWPEGAEVGTWCKCGKRCLLFKKPNGD